MNKITSLRVTAVLLAFLSFSASAATVEITKGETGAGTPQTTITTGHGSTTIVDVAIDSNNTKAAIFNIKSPVIGKAIPGKGAVVTVAYPNGIKKAWSVTVGKKTFGAVDSISSENGAVTINVKMNDGHTHSFTITPDKASGTAQITWINNGGRTGTLAASKQTIGNTTIVTVTPTLDGSGTVNY